MSGSGNALTTVQELLTSQAIVQAMLTHTNDLVVLFDGDGTITWASPSARRLFGLDPAQLVGRNGFQMIHPDDQEAVLTDLVSITGLGDQVRVEFRVVAPDGTVRWVEEVATNLIDEPGVGAVVAHLRDTTELVQRRRLAEDDRRRLAEAQASAHLGSFEMDLETGEVVRSEEMWRIIGREPGSVTGPAFEVIHPDDRAMVAEAYAAVLAGEPGVSCTHRIVRPDGEVRWVVSQHSQVGVADARVVSGTTLDITERYEAQLALAHQATHDPLTGLANRRLFIEVLEDELAAGTRPGVLFVDLDDFKAVNDRIGHVDGDAVIRALGDRIAGLLPPGGIAGRLGGDEFVVCCPGLTDTGPDEAMAVAARIQQAVQAPVEVGGEAVATSASIGVALSGSEARAEVLLRNADVAMYAAKQAGGRRAELFDDALREERRARVEMAAELRAGLAAGQVVTWFQPEVRVADGRLVGFEALARWQHPERGLVPPDQFIPLAEESGAILDLGRQVLGDACRALATWRADGADLELGVAVNISPLQLADPAFPEAVRRAVDEAGVPPSLVCLEVTESSLMDVEIASEVLRGLREVGVAVAIDDFGTGYSSLSRLKRFPVDFLKVDRSFVAGLGVDPEDDAIVGGVVGLAASLGLRVIAEGIETAAQRDALAALGCAYGQGYLWSRPLDADAARALAAHSEIGGGWRR